MTNYEAIISMSIDDMATFLCGSGSDMGCKDCCYKNNEQGCKVVKGAYRNWLNKEKKE